MYWLCTAFEFQAALPFLDLTCNVLPMEAFPVQHPTQLKASPATDLTCAGAAYYLGYWTTAQDYWAAPWFAPAGYSVRYLPTLSGMPYSLENYTHLWVTPACASMCCAATSAIWLLATDLRRLGS
jgi:hypothetical protein